MPFPTEHAARIKSPGKYKRFRRQNNEFGSGVDAIFGITADGKAEVQTIRFAADKFTPTQARKWLVDNDYKPIEFEPASDGKGVAMADEEVKEVVVEEKCVDYGMNMPKSVVPMGVTSFAQLQAAEAAEEATDEVHELASQFQGIVNNIMADMMLEDKATAVTNAAAEFATLVDQAMSGAEEKERTEDKATWDTATVNNFPDSSFIYVEPGDKDEDGRTVPRSKRHFPVKDGSGKVDIPHLRNAIARIPQSNAPGLSGEKKRGLQERARKMLAEANKESWLSETVSKVGEFFGLKPKEAPQPEPTPDPGLMLWKDGNRYRWLAIFSNKYRDKDNPPEILASAAHKDFVAAVDSHEWPYPELRHWHIKGSRWGEADWMHYDEQTGFNMACGLVDVGHESEAEAMAAAIEKGTAICVSHGMPVSEIRRDDKDSTVITRYRSIEISDLPAWAAANPLTGFDILKEGIMPIPEQKKTYLRDVAGLNDEQIAAIEALPNDKAKQAEEEKLEHKDAVPEVVAEAQVETPMPAPAPDAPITREEILAAIQTVVTQLEPRFAALEAGQKELKEVREIEAKDIAAATPAFSLVQMIQGAQQRAVGDPAAQVEKGTRVKGPKETKPDPAQERMVSIPFLNDLLTGRQVEQ